MPRHDDERRGVAAWLRRWWRALVAELASTALLVGLGIAAMLPLLPGDVPLAHPAMAFGCVVTGLAVAVGPVSGAHMNPAVTLAAVLAGRLPWAPAVGYALAQMVGAILGFGALMGVAPRGWAGGCTAPARAIGAPAAAAVEAAITGLLALVCCAVWAAHDPARPDPSVPIKIGLVVAGLVYVGGAATGASLNPARSFAPALLHGNWTDHWVYWVGPLGGAALAALLHRFVLTPPTRAPAAAPEELPLADKP